MLSNKIIPQEEISDWQRSIDEIEKDYVEAYNTGHIDAQNVDAQNAFSTKLTIFLDKLPIHNGIFSQIREAMLPLILDGEVTAALVDQDYECKEIVKNILSHIRKLDHHSEEDVFENLAKLLFLIANLYECIDAYDIALSFYENSKNTYLKIYSESDCYISTMIAECHMQAADIFHIQNKFNDAVTNYYFAIKYLMNTDNDMNVRDTKIVHCKKTIGECYLELKKYDESIESFTDLIRFIEKNNVFSFDLARSNYYIAMAYFGKRLFDQAKIYYNRSEDVLINNHEKIDDDDDDVSFLFFNICLKKYELYNEVCDHNEIINQVKSIISKMNNDIITINKEKYPKWKTLLQPSVAATNDDKALFLLITAIFSDKIIDHETTGGREDICMANLMRIYFDWIHDQDRRLKNGDLFFLLQCLMLFEKICNQTPVSQNKFLLELKDKMAILKEKSTQLQEIINKSISLSAIIQDSPNFAIAITNAVKGGQASLNKVQEDISKVQRDVSELQKKTDKTPQKRCRDITEEKKNNPNEISPADKYRKISSRMPFFDPGLRLPPLLDSPLTRDESQKESFTI